MTRPIEFRATALAEALEPPVLRIGNLRYTGRLLSIEEWLPFYERQVALERQHEDAVKAKRAPDLRPAVRLWVDYLRTVFPRSRLRFFAPDPVTWLRRQPGTALREAYLHFFYQQARVIGIQLASHATEDGPSSSASTPDGASAAE